RLANTKEFLGFEWYYLWHLGRYERLILHAHTSEAQSIAFSPDNRHLASGGFDNTVKIWDAITGEHLKSFTLSTAKINPIRPPLSQVNGLAYDPAGTHVAAACGDGMVRIWDLGTGQETRAFKAHRTAKSLAYSPDGKHLATSGHDTGVKIWNLAT